jgi:hypothetical protein
VAVLAGDADRRLRRLRAGAADHAAVRRAPLRPPRPPPGAISAWLLDLQPAEKPTLGGAAAIAPQVGLAVGALVSGILVEYAPDPLRVDRRRGADDYGISDATYGYGVVVIALAAFTALAIWRGAHRAPAEA